MGRGEGKSVGKPSQGIFQDAEFLECSGGIVNSDNDNELGGMVHSDSDNELDE